LGNVTITESKSLGVATIIEKVADAGVSVEGVRALDSFLELDEISKPVNPATNKVRLYAKDKGGVSWLYMLSDDGTETDLGAAGGNGGGGTKEIFLAVLQYPTATLDDWSYAAVTGTGTCWFIWQVPADFVSLNSVNVVMIPDATETIQADLDVSVSALGEDYNADTRQLLDQQLAVTISDLTEWDIKLGTIFDDIAAGDYVAIRFQSDTTTIRVIGCRISYET